MTTIQGVKKFTIDRKSWLRGEGSDKSFLLRDDGKMCCLGQYCLASNIPKDTLINTKSPYSLKNDKKIKVENLMGQFWVGDAMSVNDKETLSDKLREENLIELFKEGGIEVTFEN